MSSSPYTSSYPPATNSNTEVRPPQQPPVPSAPSLPTQPPAQPPAPLLPLSTYPQPPVTHNTLAKRRKTLSKALKLRSSHLTPNAPPQGNEHDAELLGLSGEKKRNRLGYARTNMACGNCRKRKIRCQPVKDDGRCGQCIRLKKDCQFYAVDQQPPIPPPSRAGSRAQHRMMVASPTTSPPAAPSHPGEMQAHQSYPSYHSATMPMNQDMRTTVTPGVSSSTLYNYGQSIGNYASTATSPIAGQGGTGATWRNYPSEPPVSPGYASYPVPVSQASNAWVASPVEAPAGPESATRSDDPWLQYQQPPTRSMSFSAGHPVPYAANQNRAFDRRTSVASDVYHPTSIEGVPSASYTAWQQQQYQPWYPEGGQPGSSADENPTNMDSMYYGR
ncbi:hypothetical protein F4777DRAFT_573907 [Nemania sp. FL0916]|nr:hypothetical protein F4777DRAFT_573907 [Nemania sp. FL0916]